MDLITLQWAPPLFHIANMPVRDGHTMVMIGKAAYIFGGEANSITVNTDGMPHQILVLKDLWKLDFSGTTPVTTLLNVTGAGPAPRKYHCATPLGTDAMLIHGGQSDIDHNFADTWIYNATLNTWTDVTHPSDSSLIVYGHGCATITASGTPFRFGGDWSNGGLLSWAPATGWVHVYAPGPAPQMQDIMHQMTAFGDTLVVTVQLNHPRSVLLHNEDSQAFYYYNSISDSWTMTNSTSALTSITSTSGSSISSTSGSPISPISHSAFSAVAKGIMMLCLFVYSI
ncbi:hypothetical protein BDK51DRAFT_37878 [Blyttiomyces helicus]|uniref:Galactose oxidase n=1 Tax=Blyttiomyces helicus TaxID=388810 RepID=A0A4P9W2K6_9FUNG|nr:hypothetical protein BDK51DRAFT_37878 [Blyttiomyces helicus]|eukprot:RKO86374.1 hypothetical protein BDK51DRAFT_37878 [Blyttiomyces helicus]